MPRPSSEIGEFDRQAIGDELVQTFGSGVEILHQYSPSGRTDDPAAPAARSAAACDIEHLAAVCGSAHARRPVHLHTHVAGADVVGTSYVGVEVHRAARVCAAAHGGQVLMSQAAALLAAGAAGRFVRSASTG